MREKKKQRKIVAN